MPQAVTSAGLSEYCRRMQDIVSRTEAIGSIRGIAAGELPLIVVAEVVYLQLRHILELMATALAIVNKSALRGKNHPNIGHWHAVRLLNAIGEVNRDYYPKPTKRLPKDESGVIPMREVKGGFLTQDMFKTLYRVCGQVLHTRNPFASKQGVQMKSAKDYRLLLNEAARWESRIKRLLTHHEFHLKDDPVMYVGLTVGEEHVFKVWEFKPIDKP